MNLLKTAQVRGMHRSLTIPVDMWLLQCPDCQGPLNGTMKALNCELCGQNWPVKDGVPHFGGIDHRPHALTYAQRQWITEAAATEGWEVALHDLLRSIDPAVYRQATDEYRAQWRFVLPLSPSSHILDLSCGWGAVVFNLAESCALVVATDACPAQARFVAIRARQMGQDNVIPLQLGLDESFPFPNDYFDAVVLIDALSWIKDTEAQCLVLHRVRDVLRPGGSLFLAEANRLGVSRLARRLAGGNPHTVSGYQRLLQSAGFRDFRVYALAPSHLEPFFMIPLDRRAPLAYFLREIAGAQDFEAHFRQRGQGTLYRLVRMMAHWTPSHLLAKLAKPFVPSIAIVAHS